MSHARTNLVFLLDFDNTLSNNDQLLSEFHDFLTDALGIENSQKFWTISEQLRTELGYVDYLGTIQRYRNQSDLALDLTGLASFLFDFPYIRLVYPGAFDVLQHLRKWGRTAILTDGDMVFQPYKIKASGLWHVVDGNVLIYIHKEQQLVNIQQAYPSNHYVIVDDKVRLLESMQTQLSGRVTTVFIQQGHYAKQWEASDQAYRPDFTIQQIGELLPIVHGMRHGRLAKEHAGLLGV